MAQLPSTARSSSSNTPRAKAGGLEVTLVVIAAIYFWGVIDAVVYRDWGLVATQGIGCGVTLGMAGILRHRRRNPARRGEKP